MAADDTRKLDPVENGGAAPDAAHGDLDRTQEAPARPAGEASTPESFVTFGEGAQGDPGKAAAPTRATGRPVLLGALALCCVVLIVASLGFIHPSDDGSWSLSWLFQTTEEAEEPASAGSGSAEAADAPATADASGAADGSADASAADASGQDAGASADGSASSTGTGAASTSGGSPSSSSSSSGGGSSSSSGGSQGSSGGSQTPADDRRDLRQQQSEHQHSGDQADGHGIFGMIPAEQYRKECGDHRNPDHGNHTHGATDRKPT